mmetsp:Transcript_23841/g.31680  ORF Transcript_23841/g.31680 Transcript_23841/m.31680 type:complete len:313 (+) Transcript_23841:146-1084(+)
MATARAACGICIGIVLLLLLVILLPLSYSYIDYYEYGLRQRKSTGKVSTERVFTSGRYFNGPDMKFLKYQADAHLVHLDDVAVFSDGGANNVGLSFQIDVDFTYKLKQDEIGLLHRDLAKTYENVILSRTNDAIKNSATSVLFDDYFKNRKAVEQQFREAVQTRWDAEPPMHATLGQFHLGRIKIPETVAEKQLTAKIQVEKNKEEEFLQSARLERETTAVEVNTINLERQKILRSAQAEANLIISKALSEADRIRNEAIINGTATLLEKVGIDTEEHKTAFTYIRTLQNRENLGLSISYLSDENIVKTTAQ